MARAPRLTQGVLVAAAICLAGGAVWWVMAARPTSPAALPTDLPVVPDDDAVALEQGWKSLETLEASMSRANAPNEDLLASLDAVFRAYEAPRALHPVAAGDKPERDLAAFRRQAEKAFVTALTLARVKRPEGVNEREEVNVKAARLLGDTGAVEVSSDIIKAIETRLLNAKGYTVSTGLWEAAFAALGKLRSEKSLAWIQENFTHAKSSPPEVVDQLVAAHRAIPLFRDVPGKVRHTLVDAMIRTYAGVEAQANRPSGGPKQAAVRFFWDRTRPGALRAVQHLAGEPVSADGRALATMREFMDWFREHDDPREAPWTEPLEPRAVTSQGR